MTLARRIIAVSMCLLMALGPVVPQARAQKTAAPAGGVQADPKLKQEAQARLDELKQLSLKEQAARRAVVADLKKKWTKAESDWQVECDRHKAAQREIDKMPDGPERSAKLDAENDKYRSRSKKIAVNRNAVHEGVMKQANRDAMGGSSNVSGQMRQTKGTKITDIDFRGMNGDFDAGGGYRTTEKAAKILNEMGVKNSTGGRVQVKNGVLETSGDFGMTVNADAGLDRVGSAGHQAQAKQAAAHGETYVSETRGAVKAPELKGHLSTLDDAKKAMGGLNEKPGALVGESPKGQSMAKGALKAAGDGGLSSETIEAIARQRGIKDPGNFLDKLADIKAGRATITSADEAAKLQGAARDILNASEASAKAKASTEVQKTQTKIADLEAKGSMDEARRLRQEVKDYQIKVKAQKEALTAAEKPAAGGVREPVTKKPLPEMQGELPTKGGGAPRGELEAKPAAGGRKWISRAGLILGIYGIYEGYKTASEEMEAKKQGAPKGVMGWTKEKAELAARTFWNGLGFGAMAEAGQKAGREEFEQYKKDIADGKISKDSMKEYLKMKARAVASGVYSAGKSMTYDALKQTASSVKDAAKEGAGAGKDILGVVKDALNERTTNEENSKRAYETLVKKGASTVGAQRAADLVRQGDYSEAHRLSRNLDAKRDARDAEEKRRDRKKSQMRKEAQKKEQAARKKATDKQIDLREIVIAKLRERGLPTAVSIVDRLTAILENEGMPVLQTAILDMTSMQGTFTGSMIGPDKLVVTVTGTKVTGSYTYNITDSQTSGDFTVVVTIKFYAPLQGDVELTSGTISMKMNGTVETGVDGNVTTRPFSGSFSGSFTGKGYKGSQRDAAGNVSSWSVSRSQ